MTKGSIDAKRKIFIREMIIAESVAGAISAYKKAYPQCKSNESARVGAYRLLQNVTIVQAIDKGKQEREEQIKRAQHDELQRIAREQIVSQTQLEAVLSQIATGKFTRKRIIAAIDVKSGKLIKADVDESPTETDMISAADKLLRVKGAYAPEKVQHEAGDTWIEAMKALAQQKDK